MIATHYQIDFSEHYLADLMAERGIGFLGWNTRYRGYEWQFQLDQALVDIGVGVRWLKEEAGVDQVILLGNSGGGSLMAAYQSQAVEPCVRPARDMAPAPGADDLIPGDGYVSLAAHLGRPDVLTDWLDASVTDEHDIDLDRPRARPVQPGERPAVLARSSSSATAPRRSSATTGSLGGPARSSTGSRRRLRRPALQRAAHLGRPADGRPDASSRPSDRPASATAVPTEVANKGGHGIGGQTTLRNWLNMWSLEESQCRAEPHLAKVTVPGAGDQPGRRHRRLPQRRRAHLRRDREHRQDPDGPAGRPLLPRSRWVRGTRSPTRSPPGSGPGSPRRASRRDRPVDEIARPGDSTGSTRSPGTPSSAADRAALTFQGADHDLGRAPGPGGPAVSRALGASRRRLRRPGGDADGQPARVRRAARGGQPARRHRRAAELPAQRRRGGVRRSTTAGAPPAVRRRAAPRRSAGRRPRRPATTSRCSTARRTTPSWSRPASRLPRSTCAEESPALIMYTSGHHRAAQGRGAHAPQPGRPVRDAADGVRLPARRRGQPVRRRRCSTSARSAASRRRSWSVRPARSCRPGPSTPAEVLDLLERERVTIDLPRADPVAGDLRRAGPCPARPVRTAGRRLGRGARPATPCSGRWARCSRAPTASRCSARPRCPR